MGSSRRSFDSTQDRRIETALAEMARRIRSRQPTVGATPQAVAGDSEAAFRAVMEERLRGLEQEIREVKGRVNGLLFLLAGTVLAQFVLRLITG